MMTMASAVGAAHSYINTTLWDRVLVPIELSGEGAVTTGAPE